MEQTTSSPTPRHVVYVAGPMTGFPDQNYPAFNAAAEKLRALGYGVLNPVDCEQDNDTGAPQAWSWYMRRALAMLIRADAVALLPGWEMSRGAMLEVHVSEQLGMDIRALDGWL